MTKLLEESLGNLKYPLMGLLLLGVLYLVFKQSGLNYNLRSNPFCSTLDSKNKTEGYAVGSSNTMRYLHTTGDSQTHRQLRGK